MSAVSPDRWSCPVCHRTVVVDGSALDTRAALDAVRTRHGKGHDGKDVDHGPEVIAALGLPDPKPARRTPVGRRNQAGRRH
jgi:hypothetical protein